LDLNFTGVLYGLAELGDELGIVFAALQRLFLREEFSMQYPAFLVIEVFLHLISPLVFLTAQPLPKTFFGRSAWRSTLITLGLTPAYEFGPLDVVLRRQIGF
jgi:hypothetical protein